MKKVFQKYGVYMLEAALAFVLLASDLVSKAAVKSFLGGRAGYSVIDGIFALEWHENRGSAFNFMSGEVALLSVITGIGVAAAVFFLVFRPRTPEAFRVSLILIAAGGAGNFIDRVVFGYVRDFIDYKFLDTFFGINFAIGNIADVFVLAGVALFAVYMLFGYEEGDFSKNRIIRAAEKAGAEDKSGAEDGSCTVEKAGADDKNGAEEGSGEA